MNKSSEKKKKEIEIETEQVNENEKSDSMNQIALTSSEKYFESAKDKRTFFIVKLI